MTDVLTREQRSRNMASIRSRGNASTERVFAELLRTAHLSGWRRHGPLPGRPDFVFPAGRVAVFIDGCFWHGCPKCYRLPQDNRPYWRDKVRNNRRRDRRNVRVLTQNDWKVIRIWEHALGSRQGQAGAIRRLLLALERPYEQSSTFGLSSVAETDRLGRLTPRALTAKVLPNLPMQPTRAKRRAQGGRRGARG